MRCSELVQARKQDVKISKSMHCRTCPQHWVLHAELGARPAHDGRDVRHAALLASCGIPVSCRDPGGTFMQRRPKSTCAAPVLSVQIVVAQPMVSAAAKLRTRLFSASMRFTLYANAIVTASGSPSGMATTCTCVYRLEVITSTRPLNRQHARRPSQ